MEVNMNINLTLTEGAAKELTKVREEQKLPAESNVRVGVVGGGCSGFQYSLAFEDAVEYNAESDLKFEQHGVTVVVDKKSLLYLDGTTIGWHDELNKRGFTFDNPQATRSCGCGSSFSV